MGKRSADALQLTLAILKPDLTANPVAASTVRKIILQNNFQIVQSKHLRLSRSRAEEFYAEHRGKFFFNRLASFMSSGPLSAHILARENAIVTWRTLMGPTKVLKTIYTAPNSIRGQFGLTDTRNCTHGSDSEASAQKEIAFFFPEFDVDKWYEECEPQFRPGANGFNPDTFEHFVKQSEV